MANIFVSADQVRPFGLFLPKQGRLQIKAPELALDIGIWGEYD
jgi:hypothetical protein